MRNLEATIAACKGSDTRKTRILRTLNNQHFHSAVCNVWITGPVAHGSAPEDGADEPRHRQTAARRIAVDRAEGQRRPVRRVDGREAPVRGEGEGRAEPGPTRGLAPELDARAGCEG